MMQDSLIIFSQNECLEPGWTMKVLMEHNALTFYRWGTYVTPPLPLAIAHCLCIIFDLLPNFVEVKQNI